MVRIGQQVDEFFDEATATASGEAIMIIKCKKCSCTLVDIDGGHILSVHDADTADAPDAATCLTLQEKGEIFLHEDHLPVWMTAEIEQSQWTKGKLKCTKCGLKVGSFDFVSGTRCKCSTNSVLPPVHLIRSKVDMKQ